MHSPTSIGESAMESRGRRRDVVAVNAFCVLSSILTALALAFSIPFMGHNASAWNAEISLDDKISTTSVNTVYVNDSKTLTNVFSITVRNIGSVSMKVTWLGVHFDWEAPLDVDMGGVWHRGLPIGDEAIIPSGGTYEYDWIMFDVSQGVSIGYHDVKVGMEAADPAEGSDWDSPTTSYFDFAVYVAAEPAEDPPQPEESSNALMTIIAVMIVAAIVIIVILAVSLRGKEGKKS